MLHHIQTSALARPHSVSSAACLLSLMLIYLLPRDGQTDGDYSPYTGSNIGRLMFGRFRILQDRIYVVAKVNYRRNVHSLEMKIGISSSYVVTLTLTLTLDLLNPKLTGFDDAVLKTTTACAGDFKPFRSGLSFYRAIHTHTS